MSFNRVIGFIRRHEKTVVYITAADGVVRCAKEAHPLFRKVFRNKGDLYTLVGVYTQNVEEVVVAQDLEVFGVRE